MRGLKSNIREEILDSTCPLRIRIVCLLSVIQRIKLCESVLNFPFACVLDLVPAILEVNV